ncbi:MAG: hypothetical protein D3904_05295 [Candidatus Electrothrix sp. EH2]|nr:hypothetical protein [Candidatus Electrothrix sp. EH2]
MYTKYYLLGSIVLFFLSGCAGISSDPASHNNEHHHEQTKQPDEVTDKEIAKHVLAIDPDGYLNFLGCDEEGGNKPEWCEVSRGESKEAKEKIYEKNLGKYLDNIITNLRRSEKELLIYIHGGLNGEDKALERAKKKYKLILNDKENPRYPVFVNWRSGPVTTYKDHLWQIRQGEKEENTLKKIFTWPVYLFTDIGNSIVNTPKAWVVTGGHLIDSLAFKENIDNELEDQIKSHEGLINLTKGGERSNFFRHVQWVLTSPSKVITTPFTYTMAKPAWDIMLRRTSTLFYTPKDLNLEEPDGQASTKDRGINQKRTIIKPVALARVPLISGNGALYRFLSALEEGLDKDGKTSKVKITLIGHSMGAIVVNNIINLGLDLTYKNIVHMASADSTENFLNKVVPYIDCSLKTTCNNNKGYTPVNFYSLYLHPDNENREVSAKGFTPSGSLLTWIDGMFTTPKTVLDKRSGRWDNMVRAIELIPPNIKGQMHFTIFGIQKDKECTKDELKGLNCTAQEHGDFGDLPFWREEVWKGEHLSAQGK